MPIRRRISDPKGFPHRVSTLREGKGLTLAELGRAAGVSGTCVWNWENGNTFPRANTLRTLAADLGTTASYLVEGSDKAPVDGLDELAMQTEQQGLSIAEAKEGLSRFFRVPVESVHITISG